MARLLTFCLFAGLVLASEAAIEVTEHSTGFEVTVNGVKILEQLEGAPLMSIGFGDFEAVSDFGMYDITDTINEKYALTHWIVRHGKNAKKITNPSTEQTFWPH